jgi:hypothetical protein
MYLAEGTTGHCSENSTAKRWKLDTASVQFLTQLFPGPQLHYSKFNFVFFFFLFLEGGGAGSGKMNYLIFSIIVWNINYLNSAKSLCDISWLEMKRNVNI